MKQRYWGTKPPEKRVSEPEIGIYTKKELGWMLIAMIIATFISFIPLIPLVPEDTEAILTRFLIFFLIIFVSVTVKKLIAPHYSIKIEHRVWEFQRWGYYLRSKFKKPIPMGLIFSFFLGIFSLGYIKPFLYLQFDIEDDPHRRMLSHIGGRKAVRKDYLNQEDYGYTAAWGFYSLLVLAIIGGIISSFYNLQFGADLAKLSIFYGLWNLVPFGNLDGSRLFYGVYWGWIFMLIFYLIGLTFILI
ncbi:MAG: hypothetical protein ABIH37_02670 [archaeon]